MEANAKPKRESSAEEAALGLPPLCYPNWGEQNRFYRDGFYYPKRGKPRQRWLCRSCFCRFSQPRRCLTVLSDIPNLSASCEL